MDLRTHYPFSLLKYGLLHSYPSLQKNISTDVAVIGAGISGAFAAYHLQKKGLRCAVIDKRHVATGSTAASTSLIQYELDTPLCRLMEMMGEKQAVRSYQLSKKAITDLESLCSEISLEDHFRRKFSLQFASRKKHLRYLEKEYHSRKENGFDVEYLSAREMKSRFNLPVAGGLKSNEAGQVDAYRLTHALLRTLNPEQCPVYDHTEVISVNHEKGRVVLNTHNRHTISARFLVIACGYESQRYIRRKIEDLYCTYAIISEPVQHSPWKENCLLWDTSDPYLYLRITDDMRIMIGGMDTKYMDISGQLRRLPVKAKALRKSFCHLFPSQRFDIDFQWAGAFGTTRDGLPYIGCIPEQPNTYFALGYGGNGITFSLIAAQMISEAISGHTPHDMDIFSFNRK